MDSNTTVAMPYEFETIEQFTAAWDKPAPTFDDKELQQLRRGLLHARKAIETAERGMIHGKKAIAVAVAIIDEKLGIDNKGNNEQ